MASETRREVLRLYGMLNSELHRKCYEAGLYLARCRPEEYAFESVDMVPADYAKWAKAAPDVVSNVEGPCVVCSEGHERVWGGEEFIAFVKATCGFRLFALAEDDPQSYASLAKQAYRTFLQSTGDTYAWLDISVDDQPAQRVVFQLYSKICPRTVENFRHLCLGDLPPQTDADGNKVKLHYKGTTLFRIVPGGWIQGGDVSHPGTMKAGSGGCSVYGAVFPDECYDVQHTEEGVVGMANTGPHTNGSQFYVTLSKNTWMDKHYVAFGRIVEGLSHFQHMHTLPTKPNQAPTVPITITDCGVVDLD